MYTTGLSGYNENQIAELPLDLCKGRKTFCNICIIMYKATAIMYSNIFTLIMYECAGII